MAAVIPFPKRNPAGPIRFTQDDLAALARWTDAMTRSGLAGGSYRQPEGEASEGDWWALEDHNGNVMVSVARHGDAYRLLDSEGRVIRTGDSIEAVLP